MRGAGVVDDGRPAEETSDRARDRVIDRRRPLAPAGYEDDGPLRRYPELLATGRACPRQKRSPDGIAIDERATVRQHTQRSLERGADALRPPGEQTVHASGDRVALPDVHGHARNTRGEHHRK